MGINGKHLAYDLFGVFTAIRYPTGEGSIVDGQTSVNLFRTLFSHLSQTDVLQKDVPENESYLKVGRHLYILVRDGNALDKLELVK